MRILLVDDDELLAQSLAQSLVAQHYAVDVATDGETGWDYAQAATYDLIMLDVNLPKLDGIRLCQQLRQKGYSNPILLLTAKGDSSDKVMGLDAGADDYVVKPCTIEELYARIRALLRRHQTSSNPILAWGDLQLNPSTCEVTYQGQKLSLSAKEYNLLELFLRQPQRIFNSSIILEHLWGFKDAPSEETIRTHIKRLRQKLRAAGVEEMIDTVYGMGYRLKPLTISSDIDKNGRKMPPTPPQVSRADQARAAAIALWQEFKAPALERLAILEQAIAALQTGQLPETLHQQAEQAAHKLAGSLGMFGFPDGSRLGKDIEQGLQVAQAAIDLPKLKALVVNLRQELEQSPQPSEDEDWQDSLAEVVPDATRKPLPPPAMDEPAIPKPPQSEVIVLAVDDDASVLATLNQFLPHWGIQVIGLDHPRQLLEKLEAITPDLLILDIEMPDIDGIQLCQLIRRDRTWAGLPILFLSTHRDAETIHRLYSAGADDYITKPFTEPEVVSRIFNRLERNRLLRSLDARP